jgi:hypothetical protein
MSQLLALKWIIEEQRNLYILSRIFRELMYTFTQTLIL